MERVNRPVVSPGGWQTASPLPGGRAERRQDAFAAVLAAKLNSVRFSSHAAARLQSRGIQLSAEALQRLEQALDLAAAKGARNALVVLDEVAMVVSVVNRTVVTAMPKDQAQANVFTNIDSAVLA